jgi:DMSO/TMAO reductase YedYZ molybdopterin-dependent catalytic subunit
MSVCRAAAAPLRLDASARQYQGVKVTRDHGRGALAGVIAAGAGLAVSELLSGLAHLRVSPLEAVAESIIRLTPGPVIEFVISHFGHNDKPLVIVMTLVAVALISAGVGVLAMRSRLAAESVFALGGVVLLTAVHSRLPPGPTRYLPALIGALVAMLVLSILSERAGAASESPASDGGARATARAESRRSFLRLAGLIAVSSVVVGGFGRVLAHGRAQVEAARTALATRFHPVPVPPGVDVGVAGVAPWVTPVDSFYRVDTSLSVPLVVPGDWQVRIHGMVDKEITLSYDQLVARGVTEDWMTLCCVSNPIGGDLIGNAWWAGVRIAPILAEAGPRAGADAVLSRSVDGWTAGTPLAALMDGRNALFALAMNGEPLTPEHGFPVRMIVPGLYGYVSGTKWVVDLEVTRFSDFSAFWTQRGWSVEGPVKTESRIDVPRNGSSVSAGEVVVAGVAWAQHRGIRRVEVRVDTGPWRVCRVAADPTIDSWRQWRYSWHASPGSHTIQVRATDDAGYTQTSKVADVVPNGASGYDAIQVSVR